jgi:hypothetical protein
VIALGSLTLRLQNVLYENLLKVGVPNSYMRITWTPIFEWYVVSYDESKNEHQKNKSLKYVL